MTSRTNVLRKQRLKALLVAVAVNASSAGIGEASVIYDNTVNFTGQSHRLIGAGQVFADFPIGNEVTPGGTDRFITGVDILLLLTGAASGTFEFTIAIYRQTPLSQDGWGTGGFFTQTITGGSPAILHVDVPFFQVGDRFTWVIEARRANPDPSELSLLEFGPPVVGSAPPGFWFVSPGLGTWVYGGNNQPFSVRVTAAEAPPQAPIPTVSEWGIGALSLLFTTAATLILRSRSSFAQINRQCPGSRNAAETRT